MILPPPQISAPVYAGFWRRKAAYGIDSFIVLLLIIGAVMLLSGVAWAQSSSSYDHLRDAGLISAESAQLLSALTPTPDPNAQPFHLPSAQTILLIFGLSIAISSVYNIAFVASRWQATPGKHWLGMKIVRTDGGHVGIGRSIARHAATGISMGVLSGLGYITMAFSPEKAALHDLMCGTRVVRTS